MPMLRKDPIAGRWVIIAPERAERPRAYEREATKQAAGLCPFCAEHEDSTPETVATYEAVDDQQPWSVRVVPNKFPALTRQGERRVDTDGVYEGMQGVGAHEVIIESPTHVTNLSELPAEHIGRVLQA
ncbi:MAG: hypothetical protein ACOCV2_00595 [Persicimonas sp.]